MYDYETYNVTAEELELDDDWADPIICYDNDWPVHYSDVYGHPLYEA